MATATSDLARAAATFAAEFSGTALTLTSAGYDIARATWNGSVDKRPALIITCRDTADIIAGVNFAREHAAILAVRGGGHSVAGLSTCDDGVLLDLSAMRAVTVDAGEGVARAEPGATWGDFDAATQGQGMATTGGLISSTGVAGLTLGGGIGWLMRRYGLSCDNLLAAEVVTARGEVVRASGAENAELLWGLRGGGGNFGVVTSFEMRVHPVSTVVGGLTMFPLDRGRAVFGAYREWAPSLPDEFTTLLAVITAPPAPFVPESLVGAKVVCVLGCWCGEPDTGMSLLQPIRDLRPSADVFGPMPYAALQGMLDEGAPKGLRNYFKSGYVPDLSPGVIETVLRFSAQLPSPMSQVHFHQMGGAVARVGEDETAFSHRRAAYAFNLISTWANPSEDDVHITANRTFAGALEPFSTGSVYVNFLGDEGAGRVREAYGESKYRRLADLKRAWDPQNLFRRNQNIEPSAPEH